MDKLKVLMIPSWYPNKKDPLWGNYFIKQIKERQGKFVLNKNLDEVFPDCNFKKEQKG